MQMISKNNKGITLIALVITIVVFIIILSITLNYGLSELHEVSNKKIESELEIVQEAIMQRYALVKSEDELNKKADKISNDVKLESDTNRPKNLIGTRLSNSGKINSTYGFSSSVVPMITYNDNETEKFYEQYYYLLDENDLVELGIKKGDDVDISGDGASKSLSYIVNYSTGEIFDVANKKYYKTDTNTDPDEIYKQPTDVTTSQPDYNYNDD